MKPEFLIREVESGVEYNFITSKGDEHFQWMKVPDIDTAECRIKKIQRRRKPMCFEVSFKTVKGCKKFYYRAYDDRGLEICHSRDYTSMHRVQGGIALLIKEMYKAPIYEKRLKG